MKRPVVLAWLVLVASPVRAQSALDEPQCDPATVDRSADPIPADETKSQKNARKKEADQQLPDWVFLERCRAKARGAARVRVRVPVRLLCRRPDEQLEANATGCHVLAFPAFLPSALVATYAGVRVGGAYEWASYRPFHGISDTYGRAIGSGAVDVSHVITRNVAAQATLSGDAATGINGGTLIGEGADVGGGVDVGFVVGGNVTGSGRIALVARTRQRNGISMLLERAIATVEQNPTEQTIADVSKTLGAAAGAIPVEYRESGARIDLAWAYAASSVVSLQGALGLEHTSRYYRAEAGFEFDQLVPLRLGTALEIDVSKRLCDQSCVPLAFVFEYQMSARRSRITTLENADGPETRIRATEHVAAVGLHYVTETHPDLDVALTFFVQASAPAPLSFAAASDASASEPTRGGAVVAARYYW